MTENEVIFSLYKDQPIYRDLLQDFVSCLDERVIKSRAAFENESWKDLASLMHQLRGAAATYGYPALAEIAGSVEIASGQAAVPTESLAVYIEEIISTCKKIEAGMELT
ncbi:MAG: Hpt domain-containing protein [Oligoflexus sp.]|nr:Hpt domain-containing protein [Oligoflexus sp.]